VTLNILWMWGSNWTKSKASLSHETSCAFREWLT